MSSPPLADRLEDLGLVERLRACAVHLDEERPSLESQRAVRDVLEEAAYLLGNLGARLEAAVSELYFAGNVLKSSDVPRLVDAIIGARTPIGRDSVGKK